MRSATILEEEFMIRTAYPEIYDELCDVKQLFKLRVHLFTTALAVGVLYELHSEKKPKHDIIRLSQLKDRGGAWNMDEQRELIDLLARVCCEGSDKRSLGSWLLSCADGGLEKLNREYQEQGILDLPRILEEGKKVWPRRIEELLSRKISNKENG
jgi:hypothetical protein